MVILFYVNMETKPLWVTICVYIHVPSLFLLQFLALATIVLPNCTSIPRLIVQFFPIHVLPRKKTNKPFVPPHGSLWCTESVPEPEPGVRFCKSSLPWTVSNAVPSVLVRFEFRNFQRDERQITQECGSRGVTHERWFDGAFDVSGDR